MTAPETTRRAIMAGGAAMPVAALSAIAGAVSNPDFHAVPSESFAGFFVV